jgi:protein-S-isoprenylcysteine O-methyltransferase Ste14
MDASIGVEKRRSSRLFDLLYVPAVDKTIAVLAVTPPAIEFYRRYTSANLSFPRAVLGLHTFILILTMVTRRTPKRVTPNPLFWLLAFVATYGIISFNAFAPEGTPLVPALITNSLAFLSAAIFIYARLSLGRSIGFVPANRGIVTTGAYRFVRHPIYTGVFLAMLGFVLRSFTWLNLLMAATIAALFAIKSIVEENFLGEDADYQAYLRKVRFRWIPGIA